MDSVIDLIRYLDTVKNDFEFLINSDLEDTTNTRINEQIEYGIKQYLTFLRSYYVVHEVIKEKINLKIYNHIVVNPKKGIVIGFNLDYYYIWADVKSYNNHTVCFHSSELENDDLYLILTYGKILKENI